MIYSIYINQPKLIEWGLTINEGIILDWLTRKIGWFERVTIGNKSWYWASRNLAIIEVPCVSTKQDTIYRIYKSLHEKGLIEYEKDGKKDLLNLTKLAMEWHINPSDHSDLNPNLVGSKSENNSDLNPTDNIINNLKDKKIKEDIPSLEEFGKYAMENQKLFDLPLDKQKIKVKYFSWLENGWKDGNQKKIVNWKSKLLNTLQYLTKAPSNAGKVDDSSMTDEEAKLAAERWINKNSKKNE